MPTRPCFYCGKPVDPATVRSSEHIVPACIGGTLGATSTKQVCDVCNTRAGNEVDRPFCRDWFTEGSRTGNRVSNRGKAPLLEMGHIRWGRKETAVSYVTEHGTWIVIVADTVDGERRALVGPNPGNQEQIRLLRRVMKRRFPGVRVINADPNMTSYDEELLQSVASMESLPVALTIDTSAWDREVFKSALGLTSKVLGDEFVTSAEGTCLREFLWEQSAEKHAAMQFHGSTGVVRGVQGDASKIWAPRFDGHLFALSIIDRSLVFVARFFDYPDNVVKIAEAETPVALLAERTLPGKAIKGVAWLVDPTAKTTRGPVSVDELLLENLQVQQGDKP